MKDKLHDAKISDNIQTEIMDDIFGRKVWGTVCVKINLKCSIYILH